MPLPLATRHALHSIPLEVREDQPLAQQVYWRVGGPADGLLDVPDLPTLSAVQRLAHEQDCPLFVLGKGSNVLVADAGIRGLVIRLVGELADTEVQDGVLVAGAGLSLTVLLSRAAKRGWTGLDCFAGIPGTVGGAVVMNAGSRLGETQEPLISAEVVLPDGTVQELSKEDLRFDYRTSVLPARAIVARVRLRLTNEDPEVANARIREFLMHRKSTQPLDLPSCGSTFRNPPGDHAGRLIEAAGLKGCTIGAAQVSEKHANFIVNLGGARATDVRALIEHVQAVVKERFGVHLVREVHYAGDWGGAS